VVIGDTPIGVGRTAEVYPAGPGRVVKLGLPGMSARVLAVEAEKTRAVHDAGVPAPAPHGAVEIGGRHGFVFDRVDGELMLEEIRRVPWRYRSHARGLARVHADVHSCRTTALPPVEERLAEAIDRADLSPHHARAAKDRLLAPGGGSAVLHGDFHPGNVMVTSAGPVVIDWLDASRGDPAADVARTLWLLSPAAVPPEIPWRGVLTRGVGLLRRRYLREYLARIPLDRESIDRWRLPVVAARLAEGIEHEHAALTAEVRRLLGD
jgi:aminoglycoside phosphotransferase (APT) family kinase protein